MFQCETVQSQEDCNQIRISCFLNTKNNNWSTTKISSSKTIRQIYYDLFVSFRSKSIDIQRKSLLFQSSQRIITFWNNLVGLINYAVKNQPTYWMERINFMHFSFSNTLFLSFLLLVVCAWFLCKSMSNSVENLLIGYTNRFSNVIGLRIFTEFLISSIVYKEIV